MCMVVIVAAPDIVDMLSLSFVWECMQLLQGSLGRCAVSKDKHKAVWQHSTPQHKAVWQHSTAQHSTAQHRTGQDRTGQERTGQHGRAQQHQTLC